MERKLNLTSVIIGSVFITSFFIFMLISDDKRTTNLKKEFPELKSNESISGYVWRLKKENGVIFVT